MSKKKQNQVNQNQKDLKEQLLGMYYGAHSYTDLQNKGYFDGKSTKEAFGANTFLSTFDVLDKDNYHDTENGMKQDGQKNKEIYTQYEAKYKEFVSSQESRSKIQSPKDNKNIKYQKVDDSNITLVDDITISADENFQVSQKKKISWLRKIINRILRKKTEQEVDVPKKPKEDVLVKLPMHDENGKESKDFSIIIGMDKAGNKIISAPADIILNDVYDKKQPVKIKRGGKDYFMPISYETYESFHNEMIFGKDNDAKGKFSAISDKIKSNYTSIDDAKQNTKSPLPKQFIKDQARDFVSKELCQMESDLKKIQKAEEIMSGGGYVVLRGMKHYNENDDQNDKKTQVQKLEERSKNNQKQKQQGTGMISDK